MEAKVEGKVFYKYLEVKRPKNSAQNGKVKQLRVFTLLMRRNNII